MGRSYESPDSQSGQRRGAQSNLWGAEIPKLTLRSITPMTAACLSPAMHYEIFLNG